jgi:NAD(P)H-dependent FMN reductase
MRIAAAGAQGAGAEVTVIDLRDYTLPVFDEDLEKQHGMPAAGQRLKALFRDHDGLLIASPEYNSSITAVLKNSIDWVSRPAENEPPLVAFAGKAAVLMSASPGNLGGLRGLVHVRSILGNLGVIVLPDQVAVPRAFEAYGPDGALLDPKHQAAVTALGAKLADFLKKLKA